MIVMKPSEYISEMFHLDVAGLVEKTGMSDRDAISIFNGEPLEVRQAIFLEKLGRSRESWIVMDIASRKKPFFTEEQLSDMAELDNYCVGSKEFQK